MLVETGSTNMILREIKYFHSLEKSSGNIMTIVGCDGVIVGFGQAIIALPRVLYDNHGCIHASKFYSYLAEL